MPIEKIVPVLVSHHTPLWIKVATQSYHRIFPEDTILVIDNNPDIGGVGWDPDCESERLWLNGCSYVTLIKNESPNRIHGVGMDLALNGCRERGAEVMLHFEPDCLVTGRQWYDGLKRAMDDGAWMAGQYRKKWGPIHPCPTMWRVDKGWATFARSPMEQDALHPRFHGLFDFNAFLEETPHATLQTSTWDTALKCWFQAAVNDKAVCTGGTPDFRHYWSGSMRRPYHQALYTVPQVFELADPPKYRFIGHVISKLSGPMTSKVLGQRQRVFLRNLIARVIRQPYR